MRKRGKSRLSSPYKRATRYRLKYTVEEASKRAKKLLPVMYPQLEIALANWDFLEQLIFPAFEFLGIPESEYDWYMAWVKQKGEIGLKFDEGTREAEVSVLTEEFVTRLTTLETPEEVVRERLAYLEPIVDKWINYMRTGSLKSLGFTAKSLVATSSWGMSSAYPYQRKAFYAKSLFWVFYTNGSSFVFKTSSDGVAWSDPTTLKSVGYAEFFSIWFDGTYVHYAVAQGGKLYYRRGFPEADGSITWSADEQEIDTVYNKAYYPFVSVDSEGYAWIGYIDYKSTPPTGYCPYVIKSGNNDGTWGSTPSGFPYLLSITMGAFCVSPIPLTLEKMLVVYVQLFNPVKAQCWDGSSWLSECSVVSPIQDDYAFSVCAEGDYAHLVFLKQTSYDLIYSMYSYLSNSWDTEVTVQSSVTIDSYPTLTIYTPEAKLFCFWCGSPLADHVYFKSCVNGSWDAEPTDWFNEETELLTAYSELTSFYQNGDDKIGLVYMTKKYSPYYVKFAHGDP